MNLTAHQAYRIEIERARARLEKLQSRMTDLIGDGMISDQVNWAHVGDLMHLNEILAEALEVKPTRVK